MLVERYHLDVPRASTMLTEIATSCGSDASHYAAWLVTTWSHDQAPGQVGWEPIAVRRAVEFIHANAHRAITIRDIADAAGIGTRGVQHAFRKYRGQTPFGYLRTLRLENAHRDLAAADPARGDTVNDIAARWGFASAGRFAGDYTKVFGCPPSSTLRS
ncbi:helix-turn-helix transcriptional regulator [Actinomycetospora sp. NBRC 106375]|uniref:helix-turn-helix transcriptional regulator n=1 Tax=Actinomycetospora sp. NBRC 106375 TaxID=3032207 RepID=UPI0025546E77|nr:helix-turn-helix transcriptional regulator [Actinomycetospora sp. NBRC 106375]